MSEEFKAKPLTAKETMRLNLLVTAGVAAVFCLGMVMFHYHVDPPAYGTTAAAPTAPAGKPAKKI